MSKMLCMIIMTRIFLTKCCLLQRTFLLAESWVLIIIPRENLSMLGVIAATVDHRNAMDRSIFKEMNASKCFGAKLEEHVTGSPSSSTKSKEISLKHKKVKQALMTFKDLFCKLMHQYKKDQLEKMIKKSTVLTEAAMLMNRNHQWENTQKRVGHVSGIEVGDHFQYRAELNVIGLHRQFWSGIDYMRMGGNLLATSIVVTKRYDNARKSSDTLVYIGQGGNPNVNSHVSLHDQKLERGNLALKNSMDAKSVVRVILKDCGDAMGNFSFVYDGLYLVDSMTQERGKLGKLLFKFTLIRILEQPQTCVVPKVDAMNNGDSFGQFTSFTPRKRQKSKGSCVVRKDVVRINDISKGKENFPIRVVTSVNCVQILRPFDYIVNNIYSQSFKQQVLCGGCDCVDGCVDLERCDCIVKNGRRMPYDCNKRLVSLMKPSHVDECATSCKCSLSCVNRASQYGIQFQLEIFMTELKGWGVRTRSFIPSGSFVCEYIGEVHDKREAVSRVNVDDYIFHMGFDKGIIDATRCGNIGRFINHSCSPNLYVKDVMHDHNNKYLSHKMLFAVKDIPAGRELGYDYNSSKGKFTYFRSNSCYCGSRECSRQIYIQSLS